MNPLLAAVWIYFLVSLIFGTVVFASFDGVQEARRRHAFALAVIAALCVGLMWGPIAIWHLADISRGRS